MVPHALCIQEILALVFENSDDDKAALARSAQCCTAFMDPALDILWRNMQSVRPLQQLLPALEGNDGFTGKEMTHVSKDEWTRFDFYAQRVTRFCPSSEVAIWSARSSSSFLRFLCRIAEIRPSKISFPRLRELKLALCGTLPATATVAATPPSLRKLAIMLSPPFPVAGSGEPGNPHLSAEIILRDAARYTPLLDHISIVGPLSITLVMCITQFNSLRVLNLTHAIGIADYPAIGDAYHHLLQALSTSDHLVELRLPRTLHAEHIPQCSGFSHLETLHLGDRLFTSSRFISTISSHNLRALTILPADPVFRATHDAWRLSLEELRMHCESSLRYLFLHVRTVEVDDAISLTQFLQPIMKLSGLEYISFTLPLEATDKALHDMALAWPKIKSFKMYCQPPNPNSHFCTIRCLTSFTQSCPDLVTLAIHIDHKDLPDISDIQFPSSRHGLKDIDLVANQVQDYHGLARILDAAFPMLEHVVVRNLGPRGMQIPTNGLPLGIPVLQKLRSREDVPRFIRQFRDLRLRQVMLPG